MEVAEKPTTHTKTIVRDFIWTTKFKDGGSRTGWLPALIGDFDPGTPFHVAHDTLEHLNPKDGSFEAEMKAFGATLYVRGESDYWDLKSEWTLEDNPLQVLFGGGVGDTDPAVRMFTDFYSFLSEDEREVTVPPATEPIPHETELIIDHLLSLGVKKHPDHLKGRHNRASQDWMDRVTNAFGWMRIGYHEAATLYESVPRSARGRMFLRIEKMCNAISDDAEMHKGCKLRVTVDLSGRAISMRILTGNNHSVAERKGRF